MRKYALLAVLLFIVIAAIYSGCSSSAVPPSDEDDSPIPTASPNEYSTIVNSKFGCGARDTTDMETLEDLGVHWKRVPADVTKSQISGEDFDFTSIDQEVTTNQAHGIISYIIINPRSESGVWMSADEFAAFMAKVVERYDGDGVDDMSGLVYPVYNYEICNEIYADKDDWAGFTVAIYKDFLEKTQSAVHGANSNARLFCGAQVGPPDSSSPDANPTFDDLITLGGGSFFDAISYHEYSEMLKLDQTESYLFVYNLEDKPIFGTEVDMQLEYNTVPRPSLNEQANMLVKSFAYALAHSNVKVLIYTELQEKDQFKDELKWSCLIDGDGNKKPTYYCLKKLIQAIDYFDAASYAVDGGKYTCLFTVNGKKVYVIWADSDSTFTLSSGVSRVLVTTMEPDDNGNLSIEEETVVGGVVTVTGGATVKIVEEK